VTWFKVDDSFYRHGKVRRLGADRVGAVGLWTLCGGWSADNLTDGFVPWEVISEWDSKRKFSNKLITVGLWILDERDNEQGITFHDWHDWQPSRQQVIQRRKADAERRARWRNANSHAVTPPVTDVSEDPESRRDTTRDTTRESRGESQQESQHPDPTRPVLKEQPLVPRKRATRIPEDFQPTAEMVAWARENAPHVDGRRETEKFINYWMTKSGKDATKHDWPRVWRNWFMSAEDRSPRPGRLSIVDDQDPAVTGKRRTQLS